MATMRRLKRHRLFNGKRYERYHSYFDTKKDGEFDAVIRRQMGYKARITSAREDGYTWWFLWLRKK